MYHIGQRTLGVLISDMPDVVSHPKPAVVVGYPSAKCLMCEVEVISGLPEWAEVVRMGKIHPSVVVRHTSMATGAICKSSRPTSHRESNIQYVGSCFQGPRRAAMTHCSGQMAALYSDIND
jgi:hypothetical protein